MLKIYEAVLVPEAGGYAVELPDFEVSTWGESLENAAAMAYDAMLNVCAALLGSGHDLPVATWDHTCPEGGTVMAVCADVSLGAPEDEWMGVSDAASILGVTEVRVRAMAREGVLTARKIGNIWEVSTEAVRNRQANPPKGGRPRNVDVREG